jgi:iron complex outermembrane receptor protein
MDFGDHRLRVNTAFFYFDYSSHLTQILATQCNLASDPNAGTPYQLNGGKCPAGTPLAGTSGISPWFVYTAAPAIIRGAELQLMANPIRNLSADVTFGYNSTRSHGVDPSVKTQPEINMSGGIQYALNFPIGSITPRVDWYYQSFMTNGPTTQQQIHPDWIVPGYSLFNARLTFTPVRGRWQLAFAGTNITNHFYWQQLGAATSGTPPALNPAVARVGTPGMPREWSVTITKDF